MPGSILILWWGGSHLGLWNSFLLPAPGRTLAALKDLILSGEIFHHTAVSLGRVACGFLVSCILALPLGIALGLNRGLARLFFPLFEFLRHVPPLAVLPLLILWLGIGETSKSAVIVMAAFFPIFLNTLDGVRHCDSGLAEVGQTLGLHKRQILRRIILPAALPSIFTGLRLGLGYSWRALIGAELIAAAAGLGYMIHDAESLSRSDVIVVGVLALGCIGALSDYLFFRLANRVIPWRDNGDGWD